MFSILLMEVNLHEQGGENRGPQASKTTTMAATKFLAATVRDMDTVGHYGSRRFALLLPMIGLADAIRAAERLREGFAQYFPSVQDEQPRLKLSIGVLQVTEKDDSISLLQRAEATLDAANRQGSHRTYYHDGERCAPITAMMETISSPA
jgi:diguanylate cyclase (GGDEF)-like protein